MGRKGRRKTGIFASLLVAMRLQQGAPREGGEASPPKNKCMFYWHHATMHQVMMHSISYHGTGGRQEVEPQTTLKPSLAARRASTGQSLLRMSHNNELTKNSIEKISLGCKKLGLGLDSIMSCSFPA